MEVVAARDDFGLEPFGDRTAETRRARRSAERRDGSGSFPPARPPPSPRSPRSPRLRGALGLRASDCAGLLSGGEAGDAARRALPRWPAGSVRARDRPHDELAYVRLQLLQRRVVHVRWRRALPPARVPPWLSSLVLDPRRAD